MEENLEREVENKRKKIVSFWYSLYRNEMLLNFVINFVKYKKKKRKKIPKEKSV